ncbi:hypothetical protein GQX74_011671 [Glossina fuscipes]|nr:hypothetical protein GQX74_011671 [Glossina fuscipes]
MTYQLIKSCSVILQGSFDLTISKISSFKSSKLTASAFTARICSCMPLKNNNPFLFSIKTMPMQERLTRLSKANTKSKKTVKTDGIENQLCSCDSLDDSSSRSSNNSVNSPDANISRIRIRPVASAILNCILARQLCFEDPSCSAILEIIPRVCGPIPVDNTYEVEMITSNESNKYQGSTRPCFSLESAIRYINTIKKLFPRNLSGKEHILRLEASKEIVIPFWKRHQKLLVPLPLVVVVMSNFLIVRFCQEHLNVTQQESQYDKASLLI